MAAVWEVRVALESLCAVADVAWPTGRVETLAVAADARVRLTIFHRCRTVTRVPDSPIDHHGRPPAVGIEELRRCRVAPPEVEP